jgi:hypothetical protein
MKKFCVFSNVGRFKGVRGQSRRDAIVATFFFVMLLLCSAASAQKLKVVVSAVGAEPPQKTNALAVLETEIKKAFVNDGRFTAITRDEAALDRINKEHVYQRSGAVDDKQIIELGKQSGARYLCTVKSTKVLETFMLEAELINIENANIIVTGSTPCDLVNLSDLIAASAEIVRQLLDPPGTAGKTGGYGSGIFWDKESASATGTVNAELVKILKPKVKISEGTCVGGVRIAIESDGEPACSKSMLGFTCRADAALVVTQCRGNQKKVLKGALVGVDPVSKNEAVKQLLRKAPEADFWNEWVRELETSGRR